MSGPLEYLIRNIQEPRRVRSSENVLGRVGKAIAQLKAVIRHPIAFPPRPIFAANALQRVQEPRTRNFLQIHCCN